MQLYRIKCIDENFILKQKIINVICLRRLLRYSQRSSRSGRVREDENKIVVKKQHSRENQKTEFRHISKSTTTINRRNQLCCVVVCVLTGNCLCGVKWGKECVYVKERE